MNTFRWILLLLGIAIVVAIYFIGRRQERESRVRHEPALSHHDSHTDDALPETEAEFETDEPDVDLVDFDDLIARGLEAEVADFRHHKPEAPKQPAPADHNNGSMLLDQELVVLNLFAPAERYFPGDELYDALENAGFYWTNDQLFHCDGVSGEYLAVNALKPGTFPEDSPVFETRAVALILQLSKTGNPLDAFDEFLAIAKQLQTDLNARLCDAQRSSLTNQTIAYLRDEVRQYQFKHR